MRIVAIDTTSSFGSIALLEGEQIIEESILHSPEGFSQTLFGYLQAALARHEWPVTSVDCFAAASGPGSFTGVRVGLTAVKGLAEAVGRAAVAISNLQALAAFGTGPLRGVVMDARRGEVYGAVYDSQLRPVASEAVMPFPEWVRSLPRELSSVVSPDFSAFRGSFDLDIPVIEQRAIGGAVARIAAQSMRQGAAGDISGIDANYVRRSDAELFWRDPAPLTSPPEPSQKDREAVVSHPQAARRKPA